MMISLPNKHTVVQLTTHHIACDGWSMQLLVSELRALYARAPAESGKALGPPPVQYKDYAAWHNRLLAGAAGTRLQAYWHQQLAGPLPVLELPTDYPRPTIPSYAGDVLGFDLETGLCDGLRRLARATFTSEFMVILSGVGLVLSRYSGQRDFMLGFPVAGRPHQDLENLIGLFVNPMPLRITIDPSEPFLTLLDRIKQACLGAYEHQLYPFDRLVDELTPPSTPSGVPMFDVGFTWATIDSPRSTAIEPAVAEPKFEEVYLAARSDLWFHAQRLGETIHVDLEYATSLFWTGTVQRLGEDLRDVLAAIEAAPEAAIESLTPQRNALRSLRRLRTRYDF